VRNIVTSRNARFLRKEFEQGIDAYWCVPNPLAQPNNIFTKPVSLSVVKFKRGKSAKKITIK
jgi:hypothetical protein